MDISNDFLIDRASVLRIKADHDVEADRLGLFNQIESMHLNHMRMGKHDLLHSLPGFDHFRVFRVHRIHTDRGQDNMVLFVDSHLDVSQKQIEFIG